MALSGYSRRIFVLEVQNLHNASSTSRHYGIIKIRYQDDRLMAFCVSIAVLSIAL